MAVVPDAQANEGITAPGGPRELRKSRTEADNDKPIMAVVREARATRIREQREAKAAEKQKTVKKPKAVEKPKAKVLPDPYRPALQQQPIYSRYGDVEGVISEIAASNQPDKKIKLVVNTHLQQAQ